MDNLKNLRFSILSAYNKKGVTLKLNCGFLVSDHNTSEASYSHLISKLEQSDVLEYVQDKVVEQVFHFLKRK